MHHLHRQLCHDATGCPRGGGASIVLLCLCTEADNRHGSLRELVFPCVAVIAVSHVGVPVSVRVGVWGIRALQYGTAMVWGPSFLRGGDRSEVSGYPVTSHKLCDGGKCDRGIRAFPSSSIVSRPTSCPCPCLSPDPSSSPSSSSQKELGAQTREGGWKGGAELAQQGILYVGASCMPLVGRLRSYADTGHADKPFNTLTTPHSHNVTLEGPSLRPIIPSLPTPRHLMMRPIVLSLACHSRHLRPHPA